MVKTNYGKVEKALDEGLKKLEIEQLLSLTDKNAPPPSHETQIIVLKSLKNELQRLQRQDVHLFEWIGFPKKEIKELIQKPSALTLEEWKKIKEIRQKVEEYKKELLKKIPQVSNEQLVEMERKAHINKRHNVRTKWLPLQ